MSNTCIRYSKRALAPIVSLVSLLFNSVLWLGSRAKSSPGKGIQESAILFIHYPSLSIFPLLSFAMVIFPESLGSKWEFQWSWGKTDFRQIIWNHHFLLVSAWAGFSSERLMFLAESWCLSISHETLLPFLLAGFPKFPVVFLSGVLRGFFYYSLSPHPLNLIVLFIFASTVRFH